MSTLSNMVARLIEPPVIEHRVETSTETLSADPAMLAQTTTSLGSYCLRWELILRARVRNAPIAPVGNVLVGSTYRRVE